MPTYKLTYFNMRARAEPVRFMFHLAGVEYEDVRVTFEQWKDYKASFYPTNDWDWALVDVVTETVGDFGVQMSNINGENDPDRKAELIKLLTTTKSKRYLGNLEKLLGKNNGGKGWFVGDEITFADIHVFCLLHDQYPTFIGAKAGDVDYLKEYKLLHGFVERFKAEPKVSEWLSKRPVTSF